MNLPECTCMLGHIDEHKHGECPCTTTVADCGVHGETVDIGCGTVPTARDLYAMMAREYGNHDPFDLNVRGAHWVMNLSWYKQIRRAAREGQEPDPEADDEEKWIPDPADRFMALLIEVREDGGEPHLEFP